MEFSQVALSLSFLLCLKKIPRKKKERQKQKEIERDQFSIEFEFICFWNSQEPIDLVIGKLEFSCFFFFFEI